MPGGSKTYGIIQIYISRREFKTQTILYYGKYLKGINIKTIIAIYIFVSFKFEDGFVLLENGIKTNEYLYVPGNGY